MIKINFMFLIIQCKNISCNKFLFFKKNENILMTKKDRSMVLQLSILNKQTPTSEYSYTIHCNKSKVLGRIIMFCNTSSR